MIKKILCATDGSIVSEKAVDFAIDFAKQLDAEVVFLTADTITPDRLAGNRFWDSKVLAAVSAQENRELHTASKKAKAAGLKSFSTVAAHGLNIAATIIAYAEEHKIGHIVAGSTGRTGISRMLMGSIASDIVAKAHCPVTIVR